MVLTGPNGAGKTNLLEAISLPVARPRPAPRQAVGDRPLVRRPAASRAARPGRSPPRVEPAGGADRSRHRPRSVPAPIGRDRRLVRIDGAPAGGQVGSRRASCRSPWLTPQMDRLFVDGASASGGASSTGWCSASIPAMPRAWAQLRACAARARSRCCAARASAARDPAWLAALEAADGRARRRHRGRAARRWSTALTAALAAGDRPVPARQSGGWQARSRAGSARCRRWRPRSGCGDMLAACAAPRDAGPGGAPSGARTAAISWSIHRPQRACPPRVCSTGEQKALLLVDRSLANARLLAPTRRRRRCCCWTRWRPIWTTSGATPCSTRSWPSALQAWLTGTDAAFFAALAGDAPILRGARREGRATHSLNPRPRFQPAP